VYGTVPERVLEDAERVAHWTAPWDDFMGYLRTRYPAWRVGKRIAYIHALLVAMTESESR
jgi:hypothetical protein